jgi:plastocyanin
MVSIDRVRISRAFAAALALLAALAAAPAVLSAQEVEPPAQPPVSETEAPEPELVPLERVNTAPTASFKVDADLDPAEHAITLVQGTPVALDASASADGEGPIELFEWDLDGDGVYESPVGAGAVFQYAFPLPGTWKLGLRVTDADGDTAEDTTALTVQPPAPVEPEPAAEPDEPAGQAEAVPPDLGAFTPDPVEPAPAKRARNARRNDRDRPVARDAASQSVRIVDFSFGPKTVSVNVGDTVTWTNNGDEGHTATASDGSFDTGTLDSGQSGSHKFTKAGSFSYICKPHPFMKGTVQVAGAGGGSGGDSAGSAGEDGDSGAAGESGDDGSGGGLAQTGRDILPLSGLGLLMLLMGGALQRRGMHPC